MFCLIRFYEILEQVKQNNKYVFVDYEGTLSEAPKASVTIAKLLFNDVFTKLKPNPKIKEFLLKQDTRNIYVLGIIDTNREIEQKEQRLKKHYRFIRQSNYIFVSSEHEKVEIISEFIKYKKIKPEDVIFIDDKQNHLDLVMTLGCQCVLAANILDPLVKDTGGQFEL